MQNKPTPPTTPALVPAPNPPPDPAKAGAVTVRVKDNPDTDPASARAIHGKAIAGVVYANALRQRIAGLFPVPLDASAMLYVDDLIERMAPRDPAEEMLVIQMVLTHTRVLHLSNLANRQEAPESIRTVHEYADRASNTFRRLMLALAEYRRPTAPATFTSIKQANIASQQVIQNHENRNATNELETKSRATPALPADAGGIGFPAFVRPAGEALDAIHRPTDARRQGPVADERDEAR